ncbi:PEP-CTERM/exosortase system-associated acyltransferase [Methylobacter sp.]|uniref:PEP-CTERM/exosortase system-associated acyltransferase n=1 Tax=Methylobacter sp. TaxID=2051955 RepID=UPI0012117B89|nr:PEP-CTERM/exosortase system-associated acyltransferase [Methylobacter sp.]TAK61288.1 MAG: PEP-CTERM/exosortase system-associated acyltransferase [Methylobacter sp.]
MTKSIIDTFNEYFDIVPAISDELKNEVYKLRYQVYCLETGFEDPALHPDGMEYDEFDSHSVHYLIRHRKLGVYMATTRLILPCPENIEKLYPIEIYTKIDDFGALKHISRNCLAEASRFCVSKEFRRRKHEINTVSGISEEVEKVFAQDERRIFPHLTLALFTCLIKMSRENNVLDWYAVMEPALIRVFSSIGMNFIGIGPLTDYHGMRRPCTIRVDDLLNGVARKNTEYWDVLTNKGQFWAI